MTELNYLNKCIPLKKFIPAKCETIFKDKKPDTSSHLCGDEIKNTYINIIGDKNLQSDSKNNKKINFKPYENKKAQVAKPLYQNLNVNHILKAVETNDVDKVQEFLNINKNLVLNAKDLYGWTAMMSACCAGSKDIVKVLLKYKPNLSVTDKTGKTCIKLAESKGHTDIVNILNEYLNDNKNIAEASNTKSFDPVKKDVLFYCEICKETVKESDRSHFTSTVHLFNTTKKSGIPTSYGIPENNVGFQILLKTGWDREKGLGPEGSGHKFPPKTMLKQDRAGFGAKKYKQRITHDVNTVIKYRTQKQITFNRREREKCELKNKRKEQKLRRMLD